MVSGAGDAADVEMYENLSENSPHCEGPTEAEGPQVQPLTLCQPSSPTGITLGSEPEKDPHALSGGKHALPALPHTALHDSPTKQAAAQTAAGVKDVSLTETVSKRGSAERKQLPASSGQRAKVTAGDRVSQIPSLVGSDGNRRTRTSAQQQQRPVPPSCMLSVGSEGAKVIQDIDQFSLVGAYLLVVRFDLKSILN